MSQNDTTPDTEPQATIGDPAWIYERGFRAPRFHGDPFVNRKIVSQLRDVLVLTRGHRPERWGFVIIRTAYGPGSDDQFQHAIAILGRLAQVYVDIEAVDMKAKLGRKKRNDPIRLGDISTEVDMRPNEEMLHRYENDVLEDAALDGASVADVRAYFKNWIETKQGSKVAGDMRFAACILLDAETLAQIATVPADFPPAGESGFRSLYWVKMVEAEPKPQGAFRVHVFGEYGLATYWFDRNYGRRIFEELISYTDAEDPSIHYYGTKPLPR